MSGYWRYDYETIKKSLDCMCSLKGARQWLQIVRQGG